MTLKDEKCIGSKLQNKPPTILHWVNMNSQKEKTACNREMKAVQKHWFEEFTCHLDGVENNDRFVKRCRIGKQLFKIVRFSKI